jgi:hypothetical protein
MGGLYLLHRSNGHCRKSNVSPILQNFLEITLQSCLAAVEHRYRRFWQFIQVVCSVLFPDTNTVGPLGTVANILMKLGNTVLIGRKTGNILAVLTVFGCLVALHHW